MASLALREFREAAELSIETLAADVRISVSQLSRIERDEREARIGELQRIANRLGISVGHLIREPAPTLVKIISWVAAGKMTDPETQLPATDAKTIGFTDLPNGDYFATKVRGDSMDRVSPEGSTIVVNVRERDPIEGKAYLFSIKGEATYKLWAARPPRLEPFSTNPSNRTHFLQRTQEMVVIGRVRRTVFDL